jgi:hypothetical protein
LFLFTFLARMRTSHRATPLLVLLFTRQIDRQGYIRFKHWRLYGGRGLAGEDVSVWVYEGNLKVEYQATALSLYERSIEKKTGEITEVKNVRRLETHFRSPQLDLW